MYWTLFIFEGFTSDEQRAPHPNSRQCNRKQLGWYRRRDEIILLYEVARWYHQRIWTIASSVSYVQSKVWRQNLFKHNMLCGLERGEVRQNKVEFLHCGSRLLCNLLNAFSHIVWLATLPPKLFNSAKFDHFILIQFRVLFQLTAGSLPVSVNQAHSCLAFSSFQFWHHTSWSVQLLQDFVTNCYIGMGMKI